MKSNIIINGSKEMIINWALLTAVIVIFTAMLYPSLLVKDTVYQLGDVAQRDIKAPHDFFIEDVPNTEAKKTEAAESVLTVYDHDTLILKKIIQRIHEAFAEMRSAATGELNGHDLKTPSPDTPSSQFSSEPPFNPAGAQSLSPSAGDTVLADKDHFEKRLGIPVSPGAFGILLSERFSSQIADVIIQIVSEIMKNGVVANKELLLQELPKGITLRSLASQNERVVYNLKQFYGPDQSKAMVRIIGQPLLADQDYSLVNLIVDFSQRLIQPNISINRHETQLRKKQAVEDIKPVLYQIKAGEMLLREGERVTPERLAKLKTLQSQSQKGEKITSALGAALTLLFLLVAAFRMDGRHQSVFAIGHLKNLIFGVCFLVIIIILVRFAALLTKAWGAHGLFSIPSASLVYGIPIAFGSMTVCLFLGLTSALTFAMLSATCAALLMEVRFELFLYFLCSSVMAASWVQNCQERKWIITAGAKVGLTNMILVIALDLYLTDYAGLKLLWDCAFAALNGVLAAIVTVGIAPMVEVVFHYTTDYTLLELAKLDRPLLRRLMLEAPGTYHHSVVVGSLVEAAAAEIGANPLLGKVCGYYHDIGKLNKPLYFIENQTNGRNKHDKLAPSMSALILMAHIKDGVEIARQNKLGEMIEDTIRQHHGSSMIRYFYEKAKQLKGEENVNVDHFRYPGPKPQTKEAGLVMLADVVEASSRTLDNPTPSRIQGLVQTLINKVFSDGQLDDCELTLKDLHKIAKCFNKILNGIHHHRIEYAEVATIKGAKGRNGNMDRQSPKSSQPGAQSDAPKGDRHLKRLGQS